MSWFTDANCAAEAIKEHANVAYAVDLEFPSGHVRLGTWRGDITVNGNVFTGVGTIGDIPNTPDRAQLYAERWSYGISGIDLTVVPESELNNSLGGAVIEYEVWMNGTTGLPIGYEVRRDGSISGTMRRHGGASPVIQIDVETRLVILEKPDGHCYTTEHQDRYFFSGDLGCDEVREIDSREIIWNGSRVEVGQSLAGTLARRVLAHRMGN